VTWQAVKVQLSIHDHLEEASYQMVCEQARYDAQRGVLEYRESSTQAQVKLSLSQNGCRIERQLDTQTQLELSLLNHGSFSVGTPTLSGKTQLKTYRLERQALSLRYQLSQDHQLLTDQTLSYTWTPTDA
jgi:hypothetical protein